MSDDLNYRFSRLFESQGGGVREYLKTHLTYSRYGGGEIVNLHGRSVSQHYYFLVTFAFTRAASGKNRYLKVFTGLRHLWRLDRLAEEGVRVNKGGDADFPLSLRRAALNQQDWRRGAK
jgi:hypothetical protein